MFERFAIWKNASTPAASIVWSNVGRANRQADQEFLDGIEAMLPTPQLLDLTPYGRQETWEDSPVTVQLDEAGSWWRRDGRPVAQWTRTDKPVG